jgi:hypothetical protein
VRLSAVGYRLSAQATAKHKLLAARCWLLASTHSITAAQQTFTLLPQAVPLLLHPMTRSPDSSGGSAL